MAATKETETCDETCHKKIEGTKATELGYNATEEEKAEIRKMAEKMLAFMEYFNKTYREKICRNWEILVPSFMRFKKWLHLLIKQRPTEDWKDLIPPVDVAYLWHAYLIRMPAFVEDLHLLLQPLTTDLKAEPATRSHPLYYIVCFARSAPWNGSPVADERSVALWRAEYPDEPFEWVAAEKADESSGETATSEHEFLLRLKLGFLVADMNWYEDLVTLWPDYLSDRETLMSTNLEEYFKWVDMVHRGTGPPVVESTIADADGPEVSVDVFWHAHLLLPQTYVNAIQIRYQKEPVWHAPSADSSVYRSGRIQCRICLSL